MYTKNDLKNVSQADTYHSNVHDFSFVRQDDGLWEAIKDLGDMTVHAKQRVDDDFILNIINGMTDENDSVNLILNKTDKRNNATDRYSTESQTKRKINSGLSTFAGIISTAYKNYNDNMAAGMVNPFGFSMRPESYYQPSGSVQAPPLYQQPNPQCVTIRGGQCEDRLDFGETYGLEFENIPNRKQLSGKTGRK